MVTKVRGSFTDFAGSLDLDASTWPASTAQVTIQVASIDTGNEQRDGHLRTNDFFDAPNHPQITFTSTRVEQTAEDTVAVTGDLTIKGTTRPVTVEFVYTGSAVDPYGNTRIGFERSEEHTSELQSRPHLVCRLLLEKKKKTTTITIKTIHIPTLTILLLQPYQNTHHHINSTHSTSSTQSERTSIYTLHSTDYVLQGL